LTIGILVCHHRRVVVVVVVWQEFEPPPFVRRRRRRTTTTTRGMPLTRSTIKGMQRRVNMNITLEKGLFS
jgi:hypothetical protein